MPFIFTCPHCESKTLVESQFAGQAGACATCGKPITIPAVSKEGTTENSAASQQRRTKTARLVATICVSAVVVGAGLILIFRYGAVGIAQMQKNQTLGGCRNNARLIAEALNEYADDYDTYPPPVVVDSNGKPLYSWRVLILPYLGYESTYNQFRLDEPWDSEHNINLSRPSQYGTPATGRNTWNEPNYMLITGPGTLFPPSGPMAPEDIIDRPEQTLLVVEVARPVNAIGNSDLAWAQPGDLDIAKMSFKIGTVPGTEIGGNHDDGATCATCDGRDHFLPNALSSGNVRALITPTGGEPLPDDLLDAWE